MPGWRCGAPLHAQALHRLPAAEYPCGGREARDAACLGSAPRACSGHQLPSKYRLMTLATLATAPPCAICRVRVGFMVYHIPYPIHPSIEVSKASSRASLPHAFHISG